ncbi:MAG: serine O-acetyltransferase [Clostridia bacterium]|nr:serine O-acetyltransferase [Bacillota bacterium]MBR0445516.1 serine O-acetyltransferase [Clostridia bacterium]
MFDLMREDMRCVMDRDPAAKSKAEVFFCYPGLHAVWYYRVAHWFYQKGRKTFARYISSVGRFRTGADIHPAAEIGRRLFIDHAQGVVVGETTVIGNDVTMYQGATLGGTGKETGKRHPTIGDHVMISSGASVLGPVKIGNHVRVGAGAVVLSDVPAYATVVGVPGHVVRMRRPACGKCDRLTCESGFQDCDYAKTCPYRTDECPMKDDNESEVNLDQINLPDPVQQQINELAERIRQLESTINNTKS